MRGAGPFRQSDSVISKTAILNVQLLPYTRIAALTARTPLPLQISCLQHELLHIRHTAIMDIRILRSSDIPHVQQTNITNLPENYFCKYYMYHALTWPNLSYVAVDVSQQVNTISNTALTHGNRSRAHRRHPTTNPRSSAMFSQRWRRSPQTAYHTVTSHL